MMAHVACAPQKASTQTRVDMARRSASMTVDRLEQSLQAAQQMLAACGNATAAPRGVRSRSVPPGESHMAKSTRKCRSVQFGLAPSDFHRLRQVSEQLGWSRAELARRCLLLVMDFLEEQYPELQKGESAPLADCLNVEQLSLWPALSPSPPPPPQPE
jgi:hypothetical protein